MSLASQLLSDKPLDGSDNDSSDSEFNEQDASSDEQSAISDAEEELSKLADEASEFELMRQYQKAINDEEDRIEKKKAKASKSTDAADESDEDDDYKPVYEEVSEDEDWAMDDFDNEAIALMEDNEKFERQQRAEAGADDEDEAEDSDDEAEGDGLDDEDLLAGGDDESDEEALIDGEEDIDEDENIEDDDEDEEVAGDHRAELRSLMTKDPELKAFLEKEERDLLEFSDDDDLGGAEDEDDDGESRKQIPVTKEMINDAAVIFEAKDKTRAQLMEATRFAVSAFKACLVRLNPKIKSSTYVVTSNKIFDEVIRCCYAYAGSAILSLLTPVDKKAEDLDDVKPSEDEKAGKKEKKSPSFKKALAKFSHWRAYNHLARQYSSGLLIMLTEATEDSIMAATLRAFLDVVPYVVFFDRMVRHLIKPLVKAWCRRSHNVRCLAFIVLCKLIRFENRLFASIYKQCYVGYVSTCRSMTLDGLPLVSFMQRSFAELTRLDPSVAYQYAFVYIRQCAIHLRNATIAKRKDLLKKVYNWQYVSCLYMWTHVLSAVLKPTRAGEEGLRWFRDLVHPLVQLIVGTAHAFDAHRYVPLKAHCVRMLLQLQMNCNVFIPTLSYAAELLDSVQQIDHNRPTKGKGSIRAAEMAEIIKFSKDAMEEAGFRERLAVEVRYLIAEAAYAIRNTAAFADIHIPVQQKFRNFTKAYNNVVQLPRFKHVFRLIENHARTVLLHLNSRKIDLRNFADMDGLSSAITEKADELVVFRNKLHKGEGKAFAELAKKGLDVKPATKKDSAGPAKSKKAPKGKKQPQPKQVPRAQVSKKKAKSADPQPKPQKKNKIRKGRVEKNKFFRHLAYQKRNAAAARR